MLNEEKIAYYAYRSIGISNISLGNTIVAMVNEIAGDNPIKYTEKYFYTETIYAMCLLFEAEARFDYFNALRIELYEKDGVATECPDSRGLAEALAQYVYHLSAARMKLARVEQNWSQEKVIELNNERILEYSVLVDENVKCLEPVEEKPLDIGLPLNSPHPFDKYMISVTNHIYSSLGMDSILHQTIIHQIVRGKWLGFMTTANNLGI